MREMRVGLRSLRVAGAAGSGSRHVLALGEGLITGLQQPRRERAGERASTFVACQRALSFCPAN